MVRVRPLVAACLAAAGLLAEPGMVEAAAPTPSPPPSPAAVPSPSTADQALAARAALVDNALAASANDLATVNSQLGRIEPRIVALQNQINRDQQRVRSLSLDLKNDRGLLRQWLRQRYEQGDASDVLSYVVAGDGLRGIFDRNQAANSFIRKGEDLATRVRSDHDAAARIAAQSLRRLAELDLAKRRRTTLQVLKATEADRLALAVASAAPPGDAAAAGALAEFRQLQAEIAAAQQTHAIYAPTHGGAFSVNTDLTLPSGETADRLDSFLAGTALHDLGGAYMAAENAYHVSARYLVAHSIEESAWGRSILAVDKHNLFGFGADDSHPYAHAMAFASFADCIDHVARIVAREYLDPAGGHYAGPTLRGLNVHYASDPTWSRKIARIASTIP